MSKRNQSGGRFAALEIAVWGHVAACAYQFDTEHRRFYMIIDADGHFFETEEMFERVHGAAVPKLPPAIDQRRSGLQFLGRRRADIV